MYPGGSIPLSPSTFLYLSLYSPRHLLYLGIVLYTITNCPSLSRFLYRELGNTVACTPLYCTLLHFTSWELLSDCGSAVAIVVLFSFKLPLACPHHHLVRPGDPFQTTTPLDLKVLGLHATKSKRPAGRVDERSQAGQEEAEEGGRTLSCILHIFYCTLQYEVLDQFRLGLVWNVVQGNPLHQPYYRITGLRYYGYEVLQPTEDSYCCKARATGVVKPQDHF